MELLLVKHDAPSSGSGTDAKTLSKGSLTFSFEFSTIRNALLAPTTYINCLLVHSSYTMECWSIRSCYTVSGGEDLLTATVP